MQPHEVAKVLAALAPSGPLVRIGGGSETDVYRTADGRQVVKVKQIPATTVTVACTEIGAIQAVAARLAAHLGAEHSIPSGFLLGQDSDGRFYAVAVQPYLREARPLAALDRHALSLAARTQIEWQLLSLLRRSLRCYHRTGHMPDLYGTFSRSVAERRRMNTPLQWPQRVWAFLTQRLWQAHNLLLTDEPTPRVVLVDYDRVRWRGLWGRLYYAICWLLFWRELVLLAGREANYRLYRDGNGEDIIHHPTINWEEQDAHLEHAQDHTAVGRADRPFCTDRGGAGRARGNGLCLWAGGAHEPGRLVVLG